MPVVQAEIMADKELAYVWLFIVFTLDRKDKALAGGFVMLMKSDA